MRNLDEIEQRAAFTGNDGKLYIEKDTTDMLVVCRAAERFVSAGKNGASVEEIDQAAAALVTAVDG